jgi:DNA/RNA-binding domain of Phe-tRNA-synthetase-like protein
MEFTLDHKVHELGVRGRFFLYTGIDNSERYPDFLKMYRDTMDGKLSELSESFFAEDSILQGFRDLHSAVGRSNRTYVSSPENLLKNLKKRGSLPSINLLVDIYNTISIKTHLALGAHDLERVSGNIRLSLTSGSEKFVPLGSSSSKPITDGEYGYIDDSDEILCRMEVRQVEKTKITDKSRNVFFIVQGNMNTSEDFLDEAVGMLDSLVMEYCGGTKKELYP